MSELPVNAKIAFLGDYPPRKCGIATFTRDLRESVAGLHPRWSTPVIAVSDRPGEYDYDDAVRFEIPQPDVPSYLRASDFLNLAHIDVLSLQHEFGIFGGVAGRHILGLLRRARMPVVTTLHTVLERPDAEQRAVLLELVELSTRLVVMAERAAHILREVYGTPDSKISIIPHGIPDIPFVDPNFFKDQFEVAGRPVLLTFGLLSPGKGIEYAIRALPAIATAYPNIVYIILGATHPNLVREQGESYRLSLERLARQLGVERNVTFVNRYVTNAELCEFIGAADIYLTPYLNEAQITSGTLSYCFGAGKAVVSTPYWHAQELLAEGRGVLVPFRDADAIASEVTALLGDEPRRHAMRKNAYLLGREMIWPSVAARYCSLFAEAHEGYHSAGRFLPSPGRLSGDRAGLPTWRFDHLIRMSDSTGIFQHAIYAIPWFAHGYCTDDNARALLVSVLVEELGEIPEELLRMRSAYAAFLQEAFVTANGRFRNFMSFDRRWLEEVGSEDSHARALWALGAVVGRSRADNLRAWAAPLFESALPAVEGFTSPRAWAFAILGLHEYLRRFDGDLLAARLRETLSQRLFDLLQGARGPDWPWFEPVVTYDNARLPHALILSGRWTQNGEMREAGVEALRWLMDHQTGDGGCFRPIGSNGFWTRGSAPAAFDQQPIEAAAAVSACIEAFNAAGDPRWRDEARRAFEWFLGSNDLNQPLYDPATGGCCDGLHPNRINMNQGAESTLSFLLALAEMRALNNSAAAAPL